MVQFLHGAKGFEVDRAVFLFANGKLVATAKGSSEHITLHFGTQSRVLDIHKTATSPDGSVTHVQLFTISHEKLSEMMEAIATPVLQALTGVLRRLRPGWMARRRIGAIVWGFAPDSAFPAVARLRRQKSVVDRERLVERLWLPEFLDDLYELPDGQILTVLSCRKQHREPRMIGLGFKITDGRARPRLFWMPMRRVGEAYKQIGALLEDAARKYGTFHQPLSWL